MWFAIVLSGFVIRHAAASILSILFPCPLYHIQKHVLDPRDPCHLGVQAATAICRHYFATISTCLLNVIWEKYKVK